MFEEIKEIKDLLNSEGPLLRLIKRAGVDLSVHDLYIEGRCNRIPSSIICKVSAETLDLYFKGRLRTKELFLIRSDEEFFVKNGDNYAQKSFGDRFREEYIKNLVFGNFYYTELPDSCKGNTDCSEVMKYVKIFWK